MIHANVHINDKKEKEGIGTIQLTISLEKKKFKIVPSLSNV